MVVKIHKRWRILEAEKSGDGIVKWWSGVGRRERQGGGWPPEEVTGVGGCWWRVAGDEQGQLDLGRLIFCDGWVLIACFNPPSQGIVVYRGYCTVRM